MCSSDLKIHQLFNKNYKRQKQKYMCLQHLKKLVKTSSRNAGMPKLANILLITLQHLACAFSMKLVSVYYKFIFEEKRRPRKHLWNASIGRPNTNIFLIFVSEANWAPQVSPTALGRRTPTKSNQRSSSYHGIYIHVIGQNENQKLFKCYAATTFTGNVSQPRRP